MLKKVLAQGSLLLPVLLLGGFLLVPACAEDSAGADQDGPSEPCEGESLHLLSDAPGGAGGGLMTQPEHVLTDTESGLVECQDGRINRDEAVDCGEPLTFDAGLASNCDETSGFYPEFCTTVCEEPPCLEQVGCRSDGDCAQGEVCLCATEAQPMGACVPASCKSSVECESGECGAIRRNCQSGIFGFTCRTARDECQSDEECGDGISSRCTFDESRELWACTPQSVCE